MYDTKWSDEYLKLGENKPNGSIDHDHQCRCPGCYVDESVYEDVQQLDTALVPSEEGFFVGQQVYERDTLAPGIITAIDEDGIAEVLFTNGSTDGIAEVLFTNGSTDGIAEVLFTNGSTDGINLEHLTISAAEYCECGLLFGEGEHVCSTERWCVDGTTK